MRFFNFLSLAFVSLLSPLIVALSPSSASACACGCGVFDVGTSALLPTQPGRMAYLEYARLDQDKNWSGAGQAPAEDNDDKRVRSNLLTAGYRQMFNRRWGLSAEAPLWNRSFAADDGSGGVAEFRHSSLGDVRLRGVYSGFSPDMSSGLTFGLKLPTGDWKNPDFDRDTQIGTGSTDILLGGYRMGRPADADWAWYASAQLDQPALIAAGYRPGAEINAALGVYQDGWRPAGIAVAPLLQLVATRRWRDTGAAANPDNTGYERLVLSPGVELKLDKVRLYADAGFPIYQNVNGNQLVSSLFLKLRVGFMF